MADLVPVDLASWTALKSLVLDSVSSAHSKRTYNTALDEFLDWLRPGTSLRLHQGHRTAIPGPSGKPGLGR